MIEYYCPACKKIIHREDDVRNFFSSGKHKKSMISYCEKSDKKVRIKLKTK